MMVAHQFLLYSNNGRDEPSSYHQIIFLFFIFSLYMGTEVGMKQRKGRGNWQLLTCVCVEKYYILPLSGPLVQ